MSTPHFDTVSLFAGPGGLCEANRNLGSPLSIRGFDISADACATARAAGHHREQADVRALDPRDFAGYTGLIVTPPCPPWSASGRRTALGEDYQKALDAITAYGMWNRSDYSDLDEDELAEYQAHAGDTSVGDDAWATLPGEVADPRTALVIETARWALTMPDVEWMVCEQVPAVAELWEDLAAELYAAGWESVDVQVLEALGFGAGARRRRTFLLARRYRPLPDSPHPIFDEPSSMAQVLGWGPGEQVRTRNNRKAGGGNLFSADGPSWCLTGSTRTWTRESDGQRLTPAQAGRLQGFPDDYPWTGSRTSQFLQAADVVSPLVGTAVLGSVLGLDWRSALRDRTHQRS